MTIAEHYIQKGQKKGRLQSQQIGILIGRIQLLQCLLGQQDTPAKILAKQLLERLRALQASLEAQRR